MRFRATDDAAPLLNCRARVVVRRLEKRAGKPQGQPVLSPPRTDSRQSIVLTQSLPVSVSGARLARGADGQLAAASVVHRAQHASEVALRHRGQVVKTRAPDGRVVAVAHGVAGNLQGVQAAVDGCRHGWFLSFEWCAIRSALGGLKSSLAGAVHSR